MIKTLIASIALLLFAGAASASCDYSSDRASDGSRCGKRASSERSGGR